MAKLIFLGSSYSIPDEEHENTHLVVVGEERTVLIDCVGTPILRLKHAGVTNSRLTDMVLTHFHPDHVSGVPSLLMDMWLMGRREPLNIYGLHHTIDRVEGMMGLYDWQRWPNFFPVSFKRLPEVELVSVIETPEFKISASPVKHLIPTIGLRVEFPGSGKSFAYSCDTEPCESVVNLARKVDVLVHEATGESEGHSSARQAGAVAALAEAGALYLIHYVTGDSNPQALIQEAKETYSGPVALAEDFLSISF